MTPEEMIFKRFLHLCMTFYVLSETALYTIAQNRCIISPTSPTSLTATGGKLANNTRNVMIDCKCIMDRGGLFKKINWFTFDRNPVNNLSSALSGVPYTSFNTHGKIMTLIIPEFIDEYSGTYICSPGLTVPHRSNRATIDLTLLVPAPNITHHPENQVIELYTNNFNLTLQCKAVGYKIKYTWTKNHGTIVPNDHYVINDGNLNIINIKPSDEGRYQCTTSNTGGNSFSTYADVVIKVPAPHIITHPTDTSAAAPFSGVFTCSVQAYGKISIEWEGKDNLPRPVRLSSPELTTSTLTIPNVTEDDVGTYHCVAWANQIGAISNQAKLTLADTPDRPTVLISDPVVHLNRSNFNVSMKCMPDRPDLNYVWEKRNGNFLIWARNDLSSHITLTNVKLEDSGDYRCTFSNSTGKIASDFSTLEIKVSLPVFSSHPNDMEVDVFNNVRFSCEAVGYGIVALIWKRLGLRMPITATQVNSTSQDKVNSILYIKRANGYYAGEYYCIAENSAGRVKSKTVKLHVQVPCPEMIRPPDNITVLLGKTAKFTCLALSHGVLIYDWNREDGKRLPKKSKTSSTTWLFPQRHGQLTAVRSLTVFDAELSVEGSYCCRVSNECGSVTNCAWLEVNTIPHFKEHPKPNVCRRNDKEKEVMNCEANGYVTIKWEKYQSSSNSWIRPSHRAMNITSPKLIFSVITEEDEGVYRCVATNDDGSVISDNATITVYGPPIITDVSDATTVKEGDKAYFTCTVSNDVDSTYPVNISWYNDKGIQLKSDAATDMSELLIDPVSISDDGVYTCRAYNHPESIAEQQISLTVEYCPIISTAASSSNPFKVGGNAIIIFCSASGQPTPMVQWYTGGRPVYPDPNKNQQFIANIPNDTPHNTTYTCKAWNSVGHKSKSITVVVQP